MCQGQFIPAAMVFGGFFFFFFSSPFQPALVSAGIPADTEMLFYLI